MPNEIVPITNLADTGVILDTPPVSLPPNAFTNARNVRFKDGAVRKMEGEVDIFEGMSGFFDDSTIGQVEYLAWWPSPNQTTRDSGYYIFVVEYTPTPIPPAVSSITVHSVYAMVPGATFDPMTDNIMSKEGHYHRVGQNYSRQGTWQHTLFNGGFTFIINNGIQKPQYVTDAENNIDITQLTLADLPGWDSYQVNELLLRDTFTETSSRVFDTGQTMAPGQTQYVVERTRAGTTTTLAITTDYTITVDNEQDVITFMDAALTIGDEISVRFQSVNPVTVRAAIIRSFGDFLVAGNLVERGPLVGFTTAVFNPGDTTITLDSTNRFPSIGLATVEVDGRTHTITWGANDIATDTLSNLFITPALQSGQTFPTNTLLTLVSETVEGDILRRLTGVVRSSDVAQPGAIPNNWNPFAAGVSTADEFVIADTGTVQDMVPLQGNLYLYTNSSISVMRPTGNPTIPLSVQPVTDQYGALTTNSVLEYDGKHFVIGSDDIYLFGGHPGSIQSISDQKVRRTFFQRVNPINQNIVNLFTLRYAARDEIWVCFPTVDSVRGESDEAYIWNYRNGTWTIRNLNSVISGDVAPVPGGGVPSAVITLNGESGTDDIIRVGTQEVQTLIVDEMASVGPANTPQTEIQTFTALATTPGGTARPAITADAAELIQVQIGSDFYSGPNPAMQTYDITGLTGFTVGSFTSGGARLTLSYLDAAQSDTTNTTAVIHANQLTLADGARTAAEYIDALVTYINGDNVPEFATWTAVRNGNNLRLTSTLPGARPLGNGQALNNPVSFTTYTSQAERVTDTGPFTDATRTFNDTLGDELFTVTRTGSAAPYLYEVTTERDTGFAASDDISQLAFITDGNTFSAPDPFNRSTAPFAFTSDSTSYSIRSTPPANFVNLVTDTTSFSATSGGGSSENITVTEISTTGGFTQTGTGSSTNHNVVVTVTDTTTPESTTPGIATSPSPGQQHRFNNAVGMTVMDNTGTQAFTNLMGGVLLTNMDSNFRLQMRDAFCEDNPRGGGLIVGAGGSGQAGYVSCGRLFPPVEPSSDTTTGGVRTITWTAAGFDPRSGRNYNMTMSSRNGLVYIVISNSSDFRFNIGAGIRVSSTVTVPAVPRRRFTVDNNSPFAITFTRQGTSVGTIAAGAAVATFNGPDNNAREDWAWSSNSFSETGTGTSTQHGVTITDTDSTINVPNIAFSGSGSGSGTTNNVGGVPGLSVAVTSGTTTSTAPPSSATGLTVTSGTVSQLPGEQFSSDSNDVIFLAGTGTILERAARATSAVDGRYEATTRNQNGFGRESNATELARMQNTFFIGTWTPDGTGPPTLVNPGFRTVAENGGAATYVETVTGNSNVITCCDARTAGVSNNRDANYVHSIRWGPGTFFSSNWFLNIQQQSPFTAAPTGIMHLDSSGSRNRRRGAMASSGNGTWHVPGYTASVAATNLTISNSNANTVNLTGGTWGTRSLTNGQSNTVSRANTTTTWSVNGNYTRVDNSEFYSVSNPNPFPVIFSDGVTSRNITASGSLTTPNITPRGRTWSLSTPPSTASYQYMLTNNNVRPIDGTLTASGVAYPFTNLANGGEIISAFSTTRGFSVSATREVPQSTGGTTNPSVLYTLITSGIGMFGATQEAVRYNFSVNFTDATTDIDIDYQTPVNNNPTDITNLDFLGAETAFITMLNADTNFSTYFNAYDANTDPGVPMGAFRIEARAIPGEIIPGTTITMPPHDALVVAAEVDQQFGGNADLTVTSIRRGVSTANDPITVMLTTGTRVPQSDGSFMNVQASSHSITLQGIYSADAVGTGLINEQFRQVFRNDVDYTNLWNITSGDSLNPTQIQLTSDNVGPHFNTVTMVTPASSGLTPEFFTFNNDMNDRIGRLTPMNPMYPTITLTPPTSEPANPVEIMLTNTGIVNLDADEIASIIRNQFSFPGWTVQTTGPVRSGTAVADRMIKLVKTVPEVTTNVGDAGWHVSNIDYGNTGTTVPDNSIDSSLGELVPGDFIRATGDDNLDFRGAPELRSQLTRIMLTISNADAPADAEGNNIQYIPFVLGTTGSYNPVDQTGARGARVNASSVLDEIQSGITQANRRVTTTLSGGTLTVVPSQFSELANFVIGLVINDSAESAMAYNNLVRLAPNLTDADLIDLTQNMGVQSTAAPVVVAGDNTQFDPANSARVPNFLTSSLVTTDLIQAQTTINTVFDPLRPWPTSQVNLNREFPIFATAVLNEDTGALTQNFRGADIGFLNLTMPYESFIERIELAITPEFDTEQLTSLALWADGGSSVTFGQPINQAELDIKVYGTNSPGETLGIYNNITRGTSTTPATRQRTTDNLFQIGDDYKIDMRVHGRFLNMLISDFNVNEDQSIRVSNPNNVQRDGNLGIDRGISWNISGIQAEVMKGGRR